MAGLEAQVRIDYIDAVLADQARRAKQWNWTWGSVYVGATLGNVTWSLLSDDRGRQNENHVNAAKTAISVLSVALTGVRVNARPRDTADPCEQVADREERLMAAARSEAKGQSWIKHTGVVGINLVTTLIVGFAFDRWRTGITGGLIGVAVGEIMVWTQPNGAVHALRDYRAGKLGSVAPTGGTSWLLVPQIAPEHVGLALTGRF